MFKWGSKVGGPEIGVAQRGKKWMGHGQLSPIASAAYGCNQNAPTG